MNAGWVLNTHFRVRLQVLKACTGIVQVVPGNTSDAGLIHSGTELRITVKAPQARPRSHGFRSSTFSILLFYCSCFIRSVRNNLI